MRARKLLHQRGVGKESGKAHFLRDAQLRRQRGEFAQKRPLSRDGKRGARMALRKPRKRTQSAVEPLLRDQPAGLEEPPCAVRGGRSRLELKTLQRDARAVDADFLARAAHRDDPVGERFRTSQNQPRQPEHFARRFAVGRAVHVHSSVRAVEGDNHRHGSVAHQRQELDPNVPEIDMQHGTVHPLNLCGDPARFRAVDHDRAIADLLHPDAAQAVSGRFGQHRQGVRVKGKPRGFLPFLAEHHRPPAPQRGDLPVDVEHLRLEKSGAILDGDGAFVLLHSDFFSVFLVPKCQVQLGNEKTRRGEWPSGDVVTF